MLNSASCLAGAAHVLGRDIGALPEATAAGYSGPSDLLFLPHLSSERTPHNNRMARGVLFGAAADTDAVAVTQAVLEGVAFSVADAPDSLSKALTEVAAALVGGIAQSKLWTTILANLLNIPLIRYVGTDTGPAFGAARPARMALTGEPAQTVVVARERFRILYRALRDQFESAAQRRSNRPALERH